MNTAILASAYGYNVEAIKPWMESLKQTKFGGKVFVIVYNPQDESVMKYLKNNGVFVFVGTLTGETNMATQRFYDYAQLLKTEFAADVELAISTDIRDVVFQKDPCLWAINNIKDYDLLATSEGVAYRHEDWNGDNLEAHFGRKMFLKLADKETLCSGIIGGRKHTLIKLFETINEIALYSKDPGAFVDQIFYNIAIYELFREKTFIVPASADYCANLGTLKALPESNPGWSMGPRSQFNSFERTRTAKSFPEALSCKIPVMKEDGLIYAENEKPYAIVHQYDRFEPWKKLLIEKHSNTKWETDPNKVGFYMWAYENVESVDYIFGRLREKFPKSDIVLSSDNGEDFTDVANKHNCTSYIHGKESHGYPQSTERYGWTEKQAKLWLDRFYEACKVMNSEYVMMMDEDVLVKDNFKFPATDMIVTPNIQNGISTAGMEWINSRGGRIDYPFYSFGGGSLVKRESFISAYENHITSFLSEYEEIYKKSMSQGAIGWGWNDSILTVLMYANNAEFSTQLPVSETGNEEDPQPIIHKFKKYYRKAELV